MLFPPIISLSFSISVFSSSVNIPILGLSAEVEAIKLIVPLFIILEEDLANIPVLSWPLISIVPVFVKVAFSPDIPTDLFPVNFIFPAVSFVPFAVALVAVELLFLIKIPVAPSPSKETTPLLVTSISPSFAFPPNSFPEVSVLYAKPNNPIESFPPTSTVPSFVTSEPFTAYTPTALLLAVESFSTEIVPLLLTCP